MQRFIPGLCDLSDIRCKRISRSFVMLGVSGSTMEKTAWPLINAVQHKQLFTLAKLILAMRG